MDDIVTSAELMGKVVVVTDWKGFPKSCFTCPYCHSLTGTCAASGCYVNCTDFRRAPSCPLRIVGRWEDR